MKLQNYGIFILKPDSIDQNLIKTFLEELNNNDLTLASAYQINYYHNFIKEYRKHDLGFRYPNKISKYKLFVANLNANGYKEKYPNTPAYVVVVKNKVTNSQDVYTPMLNVKTNLRNSIYDPELMYAFQKEFYTKAVAQKIGQKGLTKLVKCTRQYYKINAAQNNRFKQIYEVRFDAIHLEDEPCFRSNVAFDFMQEHGVFNPNNKVKLTPNFTFENLNTIKK